MIDIWCVKTIKKLDNDIFNRLLRLVSDEKQSKIHKFYKYQDKANTLIADILSRVMICTKLGITNNQICFYKNEFGKPLLKGKENFHFNISHSEHWVACTVGSIPVGIDVEIIKPVEINIAKRFFSNKEYCDLMEKDEDNRLSYFYNIWTLKESYIKADGKGMSIPLNSFEFVIHGNKICLCIKDIPQICSFQQYQLENNCMMSAFTYGNEQWMDPKILTLSELIKFSCILEDN